MDPVSLQPVLPETNFRPAGTTSFMTTDWYTDGPLFLTVTIYESALPFITLATGVAMETEKSGQAIIVETVLLVSLAALGSY